MPLSKIAWIVTVLTCAVAVVLLLLADYNGYAAVVGATGMAAAVNLR